MAAIKEKEAHLLKDLVPIKTLPEASFKELLGAVQIFEEPRGTIIFNKGDTASENIYLLDGTLGMVDDKKVIEQVEAGSDTAKFPIAHQLPRKFAGRAMTKVRFVCVDSHKLSELLARSEGDDYEVSEYEDQGEGDWMSLLLNSSILQQIPAANMQGVMMRVEQVEVEEGETVVKQGDPGDFYYMLSKGRAKVIREMDNDEPPKELGFIDPGVPFGEEAILSDSPRKATIVMLTPGEVLRLSKEDFQELIHHPLSRSVNYGEAKSMIEQGGVWLDVRSQEAYTADNIVEGSINLPFDSLRYQAANLAPEHQYIVISETGKTAVSAAFLLTERSFRVVVLNGGYAAIKELAVPAGEGEEETVAEEALAELPDELKEKLDKADSRIKELEEQLKTQAEGQKAAAAGENEQIDFLNKQVSELTEKLTARDSDVAELNQQLLAAKEQAENEQSELAMIQAEAEAQEKQIEKLERKLMAAQGAAESADHSMGGFKDRLTTALEDKDRMKDQYDRDLGKLKEEITELRMALDLAEEELEECQGKLNG